MTDHHIDIIRDIANCADLALFFRKKMRKMTDPKAAEHCRDMLVFAQERQVALAELLVKRLKKRLKKHQQ